MINKPLPDVSAIRPRITVIGVGGAGSNAVNNMIDANLSGVDFIAANTDAQALALSRADYKLQLGAKLTQGLGAGAKPEIGAAAAEEVIEEIREVIDGSHIVFVAAGMGGGTGTGAASVIARISKELGILTVGVVTKPFQFEGSRRMRIAEAGVVDLRKNVDTVIVIPNQNLFRIASDKTTFAEAFILADQVLYSGVACIVEMIIKEGLINLDFADVRTVMSGMGNAMMGTGEGVGENRAIRAAENAITNPLLDDISLSGAKGLLLSITGGSNLTLYEVDEVATRVRQEVDPEANIIVGATFDESLGDRIRVSLVASGVEQSSEVSQSSKNSSADPCFEHSETSKNKLETPNYPSVDVQASPTYPTRKVHVEQNEKQQRSLIGAIQSLCSSIADKQSTEELNSPPPVPQTHETQTPDYIEMEDISADALIDVVQGSSSNSESQNLSDSRFSHNDKPSASSSEQLRSRRFPEVNEFPLVGQREYYAKSQKPPFDTLGYSSDMVSQRMETKSVWRRLVDRLMGRSSPASDSVVESGRSYSLHSYDSPQSHSSQASSRGDSSINVANRSEGFCEENRPKIPAFFSKSLR
ncbi:MAG: cell division protein FtsZ [Hyphomicrobium sp.]